MAESPSFFTDADAYERLMGRWSRAVGEVFLDWLSLPRGLSWLDVGCGTGTFTELVVERCAPSSMNAIDPSEGQINYARKGPVASRVAFRTANGQSLPFEDGVFDVAAMALVINFVPDADKAVAEIKRVVKPGGLWVPMSGITWEEVSSKGRWWKALSPWALMRRQVAA
jgi:ubiquinone/menaquinone biosynthesis C-methylase UbiE